MSVFAITDDFDRTFLVWEDSYSVPCGAYLISRRPIDVQQLPLDIRVLLSAANDRPLSSSRRYFKPAFRVAPILFLGYAVKGDLSSDVLKKLPRMPSG